MDRTWSISAPVVFGLIVFLLSCHGAEAAQKAKAFPRAGSISGGVLPVTFVDAAGRKVVLRNLPKRIVVVGRGPFMVLHLLYMFPEAGRRIVGFEERVKLSSFLSLIDPAFSGKIILNPNPGPEHIASLKPDVVIMKGSVRDQTGDSLERLGIGVVYIDMENPRQFFKDVDNLGLVLGNKRRAEEIKAYYQGRLALIHARVSGIPEQKRPGMLMLMYTTRGNKAAVQVPAESWMQTLQARTAGARPVWVNTVSKASDGWTIVNFEQMALWNPDLICIIVPHSLKPAALIASLKEDPQWRLLKAVKTGRMHAFPSDLFGWDSPEPRWILGMIWTARTAWPELFRDIDMKGEVIRFFATLYNMESSRIEKDILSRCSFLAHE